MMAAMVTLRHVKLVSVSFNVKTSDVLTLRTILATGFYKVFGSAPVKTVFISGFIELEALNT